MAVFENSHREEIPSEVRLMPASAGLNAAAALQRRNIQAGTAILKDRKMKSSNFFILSLAVGLVLFANACETAHAPGESGETQKSVPPGFPQNVNPSNAYEVNKGTTPTPGIPDAKNVEVKKGTTPTPGIPDEATIKRQMNKVYTDVNVVNNPPANQKNSAPVDKPARRLPQ
jgi:hypothetical protein